MTDWVCIPAPFENETDRRTICGILVSVGLEVRIIRAKTGESKSAPIKKFIEYRQQERGGT